MVLVMSTAIRALNNVNEMEELSEVFIDVGFVHLVISNALLTFLS